MSISMYAASVPVMKQMLSGLSLCLTKAAESAEARKFDPAVLIASRLAPDMFNLARQVQIATDGAKGGVSRLAGVEIPKYEDNEASIAELQARIEKTLAFLESIPKASIDGTDDKDITITVAKQDMHFKGADYLLHWVLPNFFFHVTAAYAILRHNGVDIGKRHYLARA
jgi:hypothetical protein